MVAEGVMHGVSLPAFSTALAFYDGYRSAWLPANVIQVKISVFMVHKNLKRKIMTIIAIPEIGPVENTFGSLIPLFWN